MAASEYKALTHVNLPFIEERYAPGQMIPRESFERMAEQAAAVVDDRTEKDENATPVWDADDHIDELMRYGSISDDPDADLHPSAVIPDPNKPNIAQMVANAAALVEEMESRGENVPARLRDFAKLSEEQQSEIQHVVASEGGVTHESGSN